MRRSLTRLRTKTPKGYCECRLPPRELSTQVADLVRRYGDGIPEETIQTSTRLENMHNWETICSCQTGEVVSAGRREHNDWYLTTIKNLATNSEHRGHGLGTIIANRALKNAAEKDKALVLAADITVTNSPSQKIFRKAGFQKVGKFCWGAGEEPADIEHFILYPTDRKGKCV